MKPTVSIIVLTYNQEPFIAQTINSILMQKTNFNIEIVIGEDCSTDTTLSIIKRYIEKDPNKFNLLQSIKNLGIQANFLRCLKACKGEFIAICEGDDYWIDANKLQLQVNFLKNNHEYGLVGTNKKDFIQNTNQFIEPKPIQLKEYNFIDFLYNNWLTTVTILIKKEIVIEYIKDYETSKAFNNFDYSLFIFAASKTKVCKLPEVTSVYRILENSASNNFDSLKLWNIRKLFFQDVQYFTQKEKIDAFLKQEILHNKAVHLYLLALKNDDQKYINEFYNIFKKSNDFRRFLIKTGQKLPFLTPFIVFLEHLDAKCNCLFLKKPKITYS